MSRPGALPLRDGELLRETMLTEEQSVRAESGFDRSWAEIASDPQFWA